MCVEPDGHSSSMASEDHSREPTPGLARRFSADISPLLPSRSAGALAVAAGAQAASKARQLRHATTFSLAYQGADTNEGSFEMLLRRHLHTEHEGPTVPPTENASSALYRQVAAATPPKKLSAKVERALLMRDQCERDLERYCDTKHRAPRGLSSPSSPCRPELMDKFYWRNPENVHDDHGQDKSAFNRLMRRLSPSMKYSATTLGDLVHLLHSCSECSLRVTFCSRCATRASEFFENYSTTELQALYGHDLPPPDTKALTAFAEAMAEREHRATH